MDLSFNDSATYHLGLTGSAELPILARGRFLNDAVTVPDEVPIARRMRSRPWPDSKSLPKVDKS